MINKRKKINTIIGKLTQGGYKITKARIKVIEVFCENDCLMYGNEIYNKVKTKSETHSVSTIYRSIAILEEVGVIEKIYIANTCYYKLEKTDKYLFTIHAKCVKCNKIIHINEEKISSNLSSSIEKLNSIQGIKIKSANAVLLGVCNECEIEQMIRNNLDNTLENRKI